MKPANKPPKMVRCKNCNKLFAQSVVNRVYCSIPCRVKYTLYKPKKYAIRQCKQCKTDFVPVRIDNVFCSKKCCNMFYNIKNVSSCICPYCNETFNRTTVKQIYCSYEHYRLAKLKREKLNRESVK